jgi:hypothetical protein
MIAQSVRLALSLLTIVAAGFAFVEISGWMALPAAALILLAGWAIADWAFGRLADDATRRRDLEDRVRNPPS